MTTIELRETPTAESMKSNWQQIMLALQPIVDNLPNKSDQDHFKGLMSLLIGKEPRISNIPKNLMYIYIRKARLISKLFYYRQIIGMDFIRRCLTDYMAEIALSLGEDGLFIKHGIGGFQRQYVEQKITQNQESEKRRSWLG